ncbi:hypothetical protein D0T53_07555 [Dysgonomonas sp. 216]|uniref:hypothetical protein n=1 Tax=Dysgonomonas sp. 216 TaxID=2302934 RepID=UPI0013D83155|nr:hypothetical protein [Dysgonomonas sp. 216]NDW18768.1 hypothetical protein [Dysgonomonas sp. 216]
MKTITIYSISLLVVATILLMGCRSKKPEGILRANIHLPVVPAETQKEKKKKGLPSVVEMKDHKGNKTTYVQTDLNEKGERQLSVELDEITVTAKLKNVPERFGKVDVDFIVTVPEGLIEPGRQLNLTPHLLKKGNITDFGDLVLNGDDFDRVQQDGYRRYQNYLSGIVPDSLFDERFVRTGAFNKSLSDYDRDERMRVYKDSMDYVKYRRYISRLNKRYTIFNTKMYNSRSWLRERLGLQRTQEKDGHLAALHPSDIEHKPSHAASYGFLTGLIPQLHLYREATEKTIIRKYRKDKYRYEFENSYRPLSAEDSASIKRNFLKDKLIAKNQKLIDEKDLMFNKLVQFPKNPSAHLDTVLYNKGHFEYYYHQEVAVDEDSRRMELFLDGYALALDGNDFVLPVSDTLEYIVSSMVQFLDTRPRYMRKIVERRATSSMRAYITFKVGKSDLDIELGNNQSEIDRVQGMTDALAETGEFVMDSISLVAGCSPEGSFRSNMQLSKNRAESIRKYLQANLSGIEGLEKMLLARPKGEDWDGLSRLVSDSLESVNKQMILAIIAEISDPDRKESDMRQRYPEDYRLIKDKLYPYLRAVDFTFHVHRKGMIKDTIHTMEPDTLYERGIKLLVQRKYNDALQILNEYNDWNTAICLMSLGYDRPAYTILKGEAESGDREYLLAVLASRLEEEEEAVRRYLRSVELDPAKRWRGTLDPEINKLIKAYGLNNDDE